MGRQKAGDSGRGRTESSFGQSTVEEMAGNSCDTYAAHWRNEPADGKNGAGDHKRQSEFRCFSDQRNGRGLCAERRMYSYRRAGGKRMAQFKRKRRVWYGMM